jgi:predicted transcriptional regulator
MPDSPPVIGPSLSIDARTEEARTILKALASEPRLRVLELLSDKVCNVSEIGEALGMPPSTATLHVNALEEAGLLKTELSPGTRGLQKMCARAYDTILVQLPHGTSRAKEALELSMPVGAYVDCQVVPTCGLVSETGVIGLLDDPASFYEPDRVDAQLLWFHHGYVEYRFPNRLAPQIALDSLQLVMEICSEAPLHHDDWPSDITLWINRVEVGTWTSPRDFGSQRGVLTPEWWEDWNSQYGLHKVWQVSHEGSFVDGLPVSDVCLDDLCITEGTFITVRIGVKPDARHVGGINIFGRKFGNYPQDIVMRLRYHRA